ACKSPANFYPGSLELIADGQPVPVSQIMFANLAELPGGQICSVASGMIAIDPEIGRIQYAADVALPGELRVNYNYGAPAAIGGGPYDRTPYIVQPGTQPGSEFANSASLFRAVVGSAAYPTLEAAVKAWNKLPRNSAGTIILQNFESYKIDLTGAHAIKIPAESSLLIASAVIAQDGAPEWNKACATLHGNIEIVAPPIALGPDGLALPVGQVQISGVWLSGQLILSGDEASVQVSDSTFVPGISLDSNGEPVHPAEPSITGPALGSTLCLNRVITGPIAMSPTSSARICNGIVDAGSEFRPAFAGTDMASAGAMLHVENSTIIGRVWAEAIRLASNTIFYARLGKRDPWKAPVWAERVQLGCVRFCWLPAGSIAPRQYECLPPNKASEPALEPTFITLHFGKPGYCLLSGDVPMAVWKGADNGSQMGVYYQIQETEAVSNIQIRSAEYMPANLQSGVFLIPSQPFREKIPPMKYGYGSRVRPWRGTVGGAAGNEEEETPLGIGVDLI
ncbi:MAG: hypothetical protein WBM24_19820, partial [Candidatus Sulfotelmatobacter sp.]